MIDRLKAILATANTAIFLLPASHLIDICSHFWKVNKIIKRL